jgi:hypothetical protein
MSAQGVLNALIRRDAKAEVILQLAKAYLKAPNETLDDILSQLEDARDAQDVKDAAAALRSLLENRKG